MKILSLWSGPRNVSTALMYSFAQRPDTEVIDEPLYAHYLSKTDVNHPGDNQVLESMENDGEKVLRKLDKQTDANKILFLKNMAHHWVGLDTKWLENMDHLFLIRDPAEMLMSLQKQISEPVLRDTGLQKQVEIYRYLEKQGRRPAVIDSKRLLLQPKQVLKNVCVHLKIPFYEDMLTWPAGAKKEDGIWARYWYENVHQTTGFTKYEPKAQLFPDRLKPLLEECYIYYRILLDKGINY